MRYLRKRDDYEKVYSKAQAIKELENQPIIDKITKGIKSMTIHTKPIIPKGFKGDKIYIYPVGTYIIKFTEMTKTISINVKRKEGALDDPRENSLHPHICTDFRSYGDDDEGYGTGVLERTDGPEVQDKTDHGNEDNRQQGRKGHREVEDGHPEHREHPAEHHELALCEVDDLGGVVDDVKADPDERVGAAHRDSRDYELESLLEAHRRKSPMSKVQIP